MFNEAQIPDYLGVFWIQTKFTSIPYGLLNLANTTQSTQRTFFSCTLTNFWYFQGKLRGVLCIFVVESLSSLVEVQFFEEWKRRIFTDNNSTYNKENCSNQNGFILDIQV